MTMRPRGSLLYPGVLAAVLAVFILVVTVFASHEQPGRRPFDPGAAALIVVAAGALTWRRRYPVAVMLVALAATLAYFAIGYANGPIWLALIIAYFGAVLYGHRLAAIVTAISAHASSRGSTTSSATATPPPPWRSPASRHGSWSSLARPEILRIRRERAADAIRSARRREPCDERARNACASRRELHDALGHHLSLISVQSGVALHVNEEMPEQARTSLQAIKQASGEALTELRSVLEILRQEGERAPRSPTSTLDRLDDLVSQVGRRRPRGSHARSTGTLPARSRSAPTLRRSGSCRKRSRTSRGTPRARRRRRPVPTASESSRCRSTTTAQGTRAPTGRRDPARASSACGNASERSAGTLEAGPKPGGGFRVRARLPLGGRVR